MGHISSKQYVKEPFSADIKSVKGTERLVALALCKENFPSVDDPLFQMFCGVRAENPVRHWYCRPEEASFEELPECPTHAKLYERFVEESSAVLERNPHPENESPIVFTPMPLMLVKMKEYQCKDRPTGDNCSVVGYFGCRHFGSQGIVGEEGVLGIFLGTRFYNEAKSLSCIQLACRCYEHFSRLAGCEKVPWPKVFRYDTFDTNLPCLRLTQKLHSLVAANGLTSRNDEDITVQHEGGRAYFTAGGEVVQKGCAMLAEKVVKEDATGTWVIRGGNIPLPSETERVAALNSLIQEAKNRWSDANAVVVQRQLEAGRATRKNGDRRREGTSPVDEANGEKTRSRRDSKKSEAGSRPGSGKKESEPPAPKEPKDRNARRKQDAKASTTEQGQGQSHKEQENDVSEIPVPRSRQSSIDPFSNSNSPAVTTKPAPPAPPTANTANSQGSTHQPYAPVTQDSYDGESRTNTGGSMPSSPSPYVVPVPANPHSSSSSAQNQNQGNPMMGASLDSFNGSLTNAPNVVRPHRSSNAGAGPTPHGSFSGPPTPSNVYSPFHSHTNTPRNASIVPSMEGSLSATPGMGDPNPVQYDRAHYPREVIHPSHQQYSARPWGDARVQQRAQQYYPQERTDYRVFLGERTPVYVCSKKRQWEPFYWRSPLLALCRSSWQPHSDQGFICYEADRSEFLLYDAYWQPISQQCDALLFLEKGEIVYTVDEKGAYVERKAA